MATPQQAGSTSGAAAASKKKPSRITRPDGKQVRSEYGALDRPPSPVSPGASQLMDTVTASAAASAAPDDAAVDSSAHSPLLRSAVTQSAAGSGGGAVESGTSASSRKHATAPAVTKAYTDDIKSFSGGNKSATAPANGSAGAFAADDASAADEESAYRAVPDSGDATGELSLDIRGTARRRRVPLTQIEQLRKTTNLIKKVLADLEAELPRFDQMQAGGVLKDLDSHDFYVMDAASWKKEISDKKEDQRDPKFRDAYILLKNTSAADSKSAEGSSTQLHYIKTNGEIEYVKIKDDKKFNAQYLAITFDSDGKARLTGDQIKKLITDNGGHIPQSQMALELLPDEIKVRIGNLTHSLGGLEDEYLRKQILAALPSNKRIALIMILSFVAAVLGSVLYIVANAGDFVGTLSALLANFGINWWCGAEAGFADTNKFPRWWKVLCFTAAAIVTIPYGAATYLLGGGVIWQTIFQYVGSFPLNYFSLLTTDYPEVTKAVFMPFVASYYKIQEYFMEDAEFILIAARKMIDFRTEEAIKMVNPHSHVRVNAADPLHKKIQVIVQFMPYGPDLADEKYAMERWTEHPGSSAANAVIETVSWGYGLYIAITSVGYACSLTPVLDTWWGHAPWGGNKEIIAKLNKILGQAILGPQYLLSLTGAFAMARAIIDILKYPSKPVGWKAYRLAYAMMEVGCLIVPLASGNGAVSLVGQFCPSALGNQTFLEFIYGGTVAFNWWFFRKAVNVLVTAIECLCGDTKLVQYFQNLAGLESIQKNAKKDSDDVLTTELRNVDEKDLQKFIGKEMVAGLKRHGYLALPAPSAATDAKQQSPNSAKAATAAITVTAAKQSSSGSPKFAPAVVITAAATAASAANGHTKMPAEDARETEDDDYDYSAPPPPRESCCSKWLRFCH